jgi:NADP-dependent 3-hydroxy acid dehydrogenase YdfG
MKKTIAILVFVIAILATTIFVTGCASSESDTQFSLNGQKVYAVTREHEIPESNETYKSHKLSYHTYDVGDDYSVLAVKDKTTDVTIQVVTNNKNGESATGYYNGKLSEKEIDHWFDMWN